MSIYLLILMYKSNLKLDPAKLIELIREHQDKKKYFEIQDAYKLIYQSVYGIGHILANPAMAQRYLAQEFKSINAIDDEALIENISIPGEIVRLNLRPYKQQKVHINRLFQAMMRSAAEISGSREKFLDLWNQFNQAVLNSDLNFDKQQLKIFDGKAKSENYPVMHHSRAYREANRPAYRVLKKTLLNNYCFNLNNSI